MPHEKRRWFRFSLRTMFVAFTVVPVWLGWNVYTVRQRNSALATEPTLTEWYPQPPNSSNSHEFSFHDGPDYLHYDVRLDPTAPLEVSLLRKWLGDRPVWRIEYTPGTQPPEMQRLFPEAIIAVPSSSFN